MHIAFLTPEYPHQLTGASGGLGTSIKNLAVALKNKGVDVSIVIYGQESNREIEEEGINLYFIKQRKYKIGGWYFYRKHIQKFINKLVEKKQVDVVEATDWTGITAFMNLECPLVIRLNGTDAYFCSLDGRKQKKKNRFFEKKALIAADSIISVSQFTAKKTNEVFGINRKFEIIPNSIETDSFKPSRSEISSNRILYFGTLIRKKGVLELAEIFNRINRKKPEAELILIGNDVKDIFEMRSTFKLFTDSLEPQAAENVTYLGPVKYDEVIKYIQGSTVVVLPSFAEALPMTWIEAMALEKPLVSSNIGWAKEVMIDGETGYTVNPKDHKTYADRILKLLDDKELRKKMGISGRKRVLKKFSTEVVVDRNIDFYNSILK